MLLEICACSYQSTVNAQKAGAHRIELCSELALGGITPSYGLLKKVMQNISIPVHVLIRPRSGNFIYSKDEFAIMKADINLCKELGFQGIVSGVLKANNTIDVSRTQELIALAKPLSFTFHRAFDWIEDSFDALDTLINVGATRILTSGKSTTATDGMEHLKGLVEKANNKLIILPAGGINAENAIFFKQAGFKEIHCSASSIQYVNELQTIPMNSPVFFDERIVVHSDSDKIKAILKCIR